MRDPDLIVGMERPDDAGVYRISDGCALILTLDFFTPIVDDPYDFGQIAVANALSDVYAMGGSPLLAMNIICFPAKNLDAAVLHEILRGGADKMQEAGVLLVGGHSVDDSEIKYGLSVTGTVHPDRVLRNTGAVPGDAVVLTKPLGTGIISTALKADMADEPAVRKIVRSMKELNRKPAEIMKDYPVSACTDVTGFGLIGHAAEMVEGTGAGMTIMASQVPFFQEALVYAGMGLIPGGAHRNKEFRALMTEVGHGIDDTMISLLHDPQTSGGLLISLPAGDAQALVAALHEQGIPEAAVIGEITDDRPGRVVIKP